jgi:hypothetical protein
MSYRKNKIVAKQSNVKSNFNKVWKVFFHEIKKNPKGFVVCSIMSHSLIFSFGQFIINKGAPIWGSVDDIFTYHQKIIYRRCLLNWIINYMDCCDKSHSCSVEGNNIMAIWYLFWYLQWYVFYTFPSFSHQPRFPIHLHLYFIMLGQENERLQIPVRYFLALHRRLHPLHEILQAPSTE